MVTVTDPWLPFTVDTETVMGAVVPVCIVEGMFTLCVRFGAGLTLSAAVAEWVMEPETAWNETVAEAEAVPAGAVSRKFCVVPAAMLALVAPVTPAGKPVNVTLAVAVKP
jgi:hypothetical protein